MAVLLIERPDNHSANHQLFADSVQLKKSAPLNEVLDLVHAQTI